MKRYKVTYHTKPGIGATYYRSTTYLYAEDDQDAHERAQQKLHREFPEYGLDHIVIESVEQRS